ncbi:uncharacterized protein LOC127130564 [Lathyrus oleraceus]|uniref:uncharacterized protein LOC127130564 n=1 Tax=Pisum sativum TaxID=3888 RepID=UPI0021D2E06A|nr:uncharacterized protein LOC127130564 [Pisum sativum]
MVKFEELSRFCLHYNGADPEGSKCVKFKSGLHPEIKQFIGYPEILQFLVLMNKCDIYDEDSRARYTHYKSWSTHKDNIFVFQNHGKPYMNLSRQQSSYRNRGSIIGSGRSNNVSNENKSNWSAGNSEGGPLTPKQCGKYGKICHQIFECKDTTPTYSNSDKQGHISRFCKNLKKEKAMIRILEKTNREPMEEYLFLVVLKARHHTI